MRLCPNDHSSAVYFSRQTTSFPTPSDGVRSQNSECPLWVKSRHRVTSASCPLFHSKRTFISAVYTPAWCHWATLAWPLLLGADKKPRRRRAAGDRAERLVPPRSLNAGTRPASTRDVNSLGVDYFGTPTNRAPVTLPSLPMSGA